MKFSLTVTLIFLAGCASPEERHLPRPLNPSIEYWLYLYAPAEDYNLLRPWPPQ